MIPLSRLPGFLFVFVPMDAVVTQTSLGRSTLWRARAVVKRAGHHSGGIDAAAAGRIRMAPSGQTGMHRPQPSHRSSQTMDVQGVQGTSMDRQYFTHFAQQ